MRVFLIIVILCWSFTYNEAQELLHVIETNNAQIIGNNLLVNECSSCLEEGLLSIQFFDINLNDLSLIDELIIEESYLNFTITSFDINENGNAICVYLHNKGELNPNDNDDKVICYNRIEGTWLETFRMENIDLRYNSPWILWSNIDLEFSKDGSHLFIAYTRLTDEPTGIITLDVLKFDEKNQSYNSVQVFETNIITNPWLILSVIKGNETLLISPGYALGGYDHQFIQFNKRDSVWVNVEPEFGQQKYRIPVSVVADNKKGDLAVYVSYDGTEHPTWLPNIIIDTFINEEWIRTSQYNNAANTSIVESISVAGNGNIIGVGYTNQRPNYVDTDSFGFVDILIRSNSEISRVHRFTYNEELGNTDNSHPYFVQLSSNGELIMINNDPGQMLIYDISELIGDSKFTQNEDELIPIKLFPNPTVGQLRSDLFEYQMLKAYNSLGQLVGDYKELEELDLTNHSSGLYSLIFYLDERPKYIGKVIKI